MEMLRSCLSRPMRSSRLPLQQCPRRLLHHPLRHGRETGTVSPQIQGIGTRERRLAGNAPRTTQVIVRVRVQGSTTQEAHILLASLLLFKSGISVLMSLGTPTLWFVDDGLCTPSLLYSRPQTLNPKTTTPRTLNPKP